MIALSASKKISSGGERSPPDRSFSGFLHSYTVLIHAIDRGK